MTTAKKLDRETTASYRLVVKAFDGAVQEKIRFTLGHVLVKIEDINDNTPQFTKEEFTSSVNETADLDDVVLRVWALDRDAGMNSELRFSITSGNTDGYFDIIPNTGDIVVKKSLDLEGQSPPSLRYSLGKLLLSFLLLQATRGARNPNLQVVITHASHVCSQHSFELPLRMMCEMHRAHFDHARLDLLSLVI